MHALLFSDTSPKLTPKNRRRESSFLGGFFWPWEHPSTVLPKAEDVLSPEGRQLGCAKASAAPIAALTRAGNACFFFRLQRRILSQLISPGGVFNCCPRTLSESCHALVVTCQVRGAAGVTGLRSRSRISGQNGPGIKRDGNAAPWHIPR